MIRNTNRNYGDLGGCYMPRVVRPRRITPPEISIILQIIRKPNSHLIIIYSLFKIIPSIKTI